MINIGELATKGEGQQIEFKESLRYEGIRSAVSFANSLGGLVLFGLRDDGTLSKAMLAKNAEETVANSIRRHTYPRLEVHIETIVEQEQQILAIEVPADKPPLIGAYLYAPKGSTQYSVAVSDLQILRRVGRTNQRTD